MRQTTDFLIPNRRIAELVGRASGRPGFIAAEDRIFFLVRTSLCIPGYVYQQFIEFNAHIKVLLTSQDEISFTELTIRQRRIRCSCFPTADRSYYSSCFRSEDGNSGPVQAGGRRGGPRDQRERDQELLWPQDRH